MKIAAKSAKAAVVVALVAALSSPGAAHMMGSSGRPAASAGGNSAQTDAWNELDPKPGQAPAKPKAKKAGPPSKLDKERAEEAERLKAQRAACDASPADSQAGCYQKMKEDHEKWHAAHDPMDEGFNHLKTGGMKEEIEARKKCNAIGNMGDRLTCLKSLSKPQKFSDSPVQK